MQILVRRWYPYWDLNRASPEYKSISICTQNSSDPSHIDWEICVQNFHKKFQHKHVPKCICDWNMLPTSHKYILHRFFWYGRYSPWWTFTSFMTSLYWSRSCDFPLQFLMPIVFITSSAESSHLTAGPLTRQVSSGLWLPAWVLRLHSEKISLPSQPPYVTFTIFGSLDNLQTSWLYLDLHIPLSSVWT
jgi:hypothetical protein